VWLYGYYPIVNGIEFITYCHLIYTFNILPFGSKERWTIYNFMVEAYIKLLTLLKKICSVINELLSNLRPIILEILTQTASKKKKKGPDTVALNRYLIRSGPLTGLDPPIKNLVGIT
jgi:hypothetical protein